MRPAPLAIVAIAGILAAGCGSSAEPSQSTGSASAAQRPAPPPRPAGGRPRRVTVPSLVGDRFEKAVHEVRDAGLEQHAPAYTGTIGNPHYNGNCKKIISQSPPPGSRLPEGGTVSIVYGVCPRAISNAHHSLRKRG